MFFITWQTLAYLLKRLVKKLKHVLHKKKTKSQ